MTNTGTRRKKATEPTALLHVNLPLSLMTGIRKLAEDQRRSITSQVRLLLESSPDLASYLKTDAQYEAESPDDEDAG